MRIKALASLGALTAHPAQQDVCYRLTTDAASYAVHRWSFRMANKADHDATYKEFNEAVNMTASALDKFLKSDASGSVGQKKGGSSEATGHQEGRRIVEMLNKKKADLTDEDYAHMRKVVGYVHRHLKQGGPKDEAEVKDSPWRLSLMNWGHDPMKG